MVILIKKEKEELFIALDTDMLKKVEEFIKESGTEITMFDIGYHIGMLQNNVEAAKSASILNKIFFYAGVYCAKNDKNLVYEFRKITKESKDKLKESYFG